MAATWARIKTWVDDRLPVSAVLHWGLDEEIPGGSRFAYSFGSANLTMFLLLAVTGILQLFYYVPTTDHAYESVMYLRLQVPFGWLIHGLHFWSAQAFVVLVGLHVVRVFVWGAYKNPREMTWIMGVFLLLLVTAMTFTGPLLAWDQLGYWAAEVGTSIAGTVPWIGDFLRRFIRGGETMGQATLSRFFIFHVAIVPGVLLVFIVVHLVAFRRFGSVGPWRAEKRDRTARFWPEQVYKDMLVIAWIIVVLIGLTAFWRAPITGLADPIGRSYTPKPAWNFLFLYQALKLFKGRWEAVGTVGIPLVLALVLLLLPFYDRNPRRNPLQRPVAMLAGAALVVLMAVLTVLGYLSHPAAGVVQTGSGADSSRTTNAGAASPERRSSTGRRDEPNTAQELNSAGAMPSRPSVSGGVQKGREVYQTHGCAACHQINGQGGTVGPDLSGEGDRGRSADWLAAQIRNPKAHNAGSIMPAFPSLGQAEVQALVDYLLSLHASQGEPAARRPPVPRAAPEPAAPEPAGPAAGGTPGGSLPASGKQGPPAEAALLIGNRDLGRTLFSDYCRSCHGPEGTDKVPNPGSADGTVPALNPIDPNLSSKDPSVFAANIDRFIQHGSVPDGPHPALHMPAYGDERSLTQPQIAALEAYILHLNGVDRATILSPGMLPASFFFWTLLVVGVIFVVAVVLFYVWKRRVHTKS